MFTVMVIECNLYGEFGHSKVNGIIIYAPSEIKRVTQEHESKSHHTDGS